MLKINPKRLNRIFQNPFYCGKIINKLIPGEVIDAKHPKLISEKNWIKVQDIIENNYRGQTKNTYFEEIPLKVFMKCHNTNDPLSREQAIAKLKEAKDLIDLGMMSQDEFDALRKELTPIIMNK